MYQLLSPGRRHRTAAIVLSTLCCFASALVTDRARAATLVSFDFEAGDGSFVTAPSLLAPGIAMATWSVQVGSILDFTGSSGRAIASKDWDGANALVLQLTLDTQASVSLSEIRFFQRASASGPKTWSLNLNGTELATGNTSTGFSEFVVPVAVGPISDPLEIIFFGSGATRSSGTWRLDDVEILGTVAGAAPVPLPAAGILLLTGLVGTGLMSRRRPNRTRSGMPCHGPERSLTR